MSKFNDYLEAAKEKKLKCRKCKKEITLAEKNRNSGKCDDCKSDEHADAERASKVE